MNDSIPAWYCIRTLHKREHIAFANLRGIEGVEAFYPRLRRPKTAKPQVGGSTEPVFPCYVFARFAVTPSLERVRFAFGVKSVVQFSSVLASVPDREMEELRRSFDDEGVLERPANSLQPGDAVEIAKGPFQGFRAVVQYPLTSVQRVQILIDLLGRCAAVELNVEDLALGSMYPRCLMA